MGIRVMAVQGPLEQRLRALRQSLRRGDIARASELLERAPKVAEADAGSPPQRSGPRSPEDRARAGGAAGVRRQPAALAEACAGTETPAPRGGRFWLIRRELAEVVPRLASLPRKYAAIIGGARQRYDELAASAALCKAADGRPEDLLFLDIESCGLIPAPVFLVGLMRYAEGEFRFEQFLARDYSEEAAILRAFAERLPGAPALVTFNGKSFDMNLLRQRCAFHGVEVPARLAFHLDLLHESRRRWRGSVPDCRLQTLEQHLCGRRRVGDIPGALIAEAYHSFVRSGDARPIADILHHNLLDLLTMGELLCHLLAGSAPP